MRREEIEVLLLSISSESNHPLNSTFMSWNYRSEAERAISVLDGYGYSNLILHCEWAAPKERK